MRKFLILIALFMQSQTSSAKEEKTALTFIKAHLPSKITNLEIGKTSEKDILSILGKPLKTENETLYYGLIDSKYDLKIEIKNKTLQSFVYDFPLSKNKSTLKFTDFLPFFTPIKLEEIRKYLESQEGHERGKTFIVKFPEYKMILMFLDAGPKKLKEIQFISQIQI